MRGSSTCNHTWWRDSEANLQQRRFGANTTYSPSLKCGSLSGKRSHSEGLELATGIWAETFWSWEPILAPSCIKITCDVLWCDLAVLAHSPLELSCINYIMSRDATSPFHRPDCFQYVSKFFQKIPNLKVRLSRLPSQMVKGPSAHANPGRMYTQRPFSSLTVTCARKWRSHVHTSETHGHMYTQVRSSAHASDGHMYTHVIVTRGHMYTPLLWIWGGLGW